MLDLNKLVDNIFKHVHLISTTNIEKQNPYQCKFGVDSKPGSSVIQTFGNCSFIALKTPFISEALISKDAQIEVRGAIVRIVSRIVLWLFGKIGSMFFRLFVSLFFFNLLLFCLGQLVATNGFFFFFVAQDDVEFQMFLSSTPESWHYRCVSPHQLSTSIFVELVINQQTMSKKTTL